MLNEEEFYKESLNANLFYLRILRDFSINIQLSFYNDNEYKEKAKTLAIRSQNLGRELVTITKGIVPKEAIDYQIYYTDYTLKTEILTEKLFSLNLATDITEDQLEEVKEGNVDLTEDILTKIDNINIEALKIATEFVTLSKNIEEQLVTNQLFSYSYPTLYDFMIKTISLYVVELTRIRKKQKKDPILVLDVEYGYNLASYEIVMFLRGLIDPKAAIYIEKLNNILDEKYPKLLDEYNNLPLSPENQKFLTNQSKEIIREIRLLIENMLKDLLSANLYFIIEPLAIDTYYRNINYFLYLLNGDN